MCYSNILLRLLAILALCPVLIRADERQTQPIWRFDLKQAGYEKRANDTAKIYTIGIARPNVTFLGPDSVVAAFMTGTTKQPPLTGTWTLHVVTLDSHTGQVRREKAFPLEGHEAGIFASSDNRLIAWLGPTLVLLNSQ